MKIKASVTINAPVGKVFDLFSNLEGIETKVTGIKSIEVLEGPAKMAAGTKWTETREFYGKEATETMTVQNLTPNKSYIVTAASHGTEYTSTYTFDEGAGGTTVTMEFVGKPISLKAKLMIPLGILFKRATKKALMSDMIELKAYLEDNLNQ